MLNFCDGMYGGIESFLLNAFYCLDKSKYDVTFLTCGRSTYDMFKDDIISKGGHVEEIPILADSLSNKLKVYKELKKFFKNKRPDIVHVNSGTLSLHLLASKAAKSEGVKNVILHSHNFRPNPTGIKEKLKGIPKKLLCKYGDSFLACSTGAALWMFPKEMVDEKKVIIIPNGVDTKKFVYNEELRKKFREEFGFKDELLIGNIGRFQGQKNHKFMVEIMKEVVKINSNARLLLVGEGELKEEIVNSVKENLLQDNVLFLGERKDMNAFLSAIDVFIFPSIYEGFGIAAVEAESSGVKTIVSDKVPKETNVSGAAIYLPIDNQTDASLWAKEICTNNTLDRIEENRKVFDAGFDVHICYEKMIGMYN